jgi:hypothetical protein
MIRKIARLFVIKNRFEAYGIIYAIAVGAVGRGLHYMEIYPGFLGYVFFAACTGAVFMAGAKILDAVSPKRKGEEERRQGPDRRVPIATANDGAQLANLTNA